jgi:replicative DNA helicase
MVDFPETPDSNTVAENSLLGSVLLVPDALGVTYPITKGCHFHLETLGKAYDVAWELYCKGEACDAVTLAERMTADDQKEDWFALIQEVLESVPHAAHAQYYARIVFENWQRRQVYYAASQIARDCGDRSIETGSLIAGATVEFERIQQAKPIGAQGPLNDLQEFLVDFEAQTQPGLMTGFYDIDDILNGLQPGSLTILAARPSMGKTAFTCEIVRQVTIRGSRVLFISLETSRRGLLERILAMHGRIDANSLRKKDLNDGDRHAMLEAVTEISNLPLLIDDNWEQRVSDINAAARSIQAKRGLALVVIDYLQLVTPSDSRAPREQQVSRISRELKGMAKQLKVPVLCLAQLSRANESRSDKEPILSDLRESGAIEQDADAVLMLHRPWVYDHSKDVEQAICYVRKNRDGRIGEVNLRWEGSYMLFQNIAKPSQEEREGFETNGRFISDGFF